MRCNCQENCGRKKDIKSDSKNKPAIAYPLIFDGGTPLMAA